MGGLASLSQEGKTPLPNHPSTAAHPAWRGMGEQGGDSASASGVPHWPEVLPSAHGAVLFSSSEAGVAVSSFLPCFDGNLELQDSCVLL